jgi:hypothetical protein
MGWRQDGLSDRGSEPRQFDLFGGNRRSRPTGHQRRPLPAEASELIDYN